MLAVYVNVVSVFHKMKNTESRCK